MKVITILLLASLCSFRPANNPSNEAEREVLLRLDKQDKLKSCEQFVAQLKKYGLGLEQSAFSRKSGFIRKIKLHLKHQEGLDWRIQATGFNHLEIRLHLDEADQMTHFTYRLNERGPFSKPVRLNSRGTTSFRYSEQKSTSSSVNIQ
ncbi:MAG: hypothetical protein R2828_19880 [Saprospiraceae bacterium]